MSFLPVTGFKVDFQDASYVAHLRERMQGRLDSLFWLKRQKMMAIISCLKK